jgi:hypothetical protein
MLKFIEYLIHSPQEDLSIVREALDEEQSLLDQRSLLCILCGFVSQPNDLIEYMLSILLIGNQHQQPNGPISQCHIIGIQTLDQHHLPAIQTLPVKFS